MTGKKKGRGKKYGTFDAEFDTGLRVEKARVLIPEELVAVFEAVQARLPGLEWLAYLRGEWRGASFILSTDYLIPEQTVTSASVEVDDEWALKARREGYNAVIHSHHHLGLHEFSGTDDSYLADFDASLLWADGRVARAVVRLRNPQGEWVWVDAEVEVVKKPAPPVEGIERIKRYATTYGTSYGGYGYYYPKYYTGSSYDVYSDYGEQYGNTAEEESEYFED